MTNEEILKKAIEKAVKNGFDPEIPGFFLKWSEWIDNEEEMLRSIMNSQSLHSLIFSHDFAKAFWGLDLQTVIDKERTAYKYNRITKEPEIVSSDLYGFEMPAWQYHLQQMVLEEDPIKYLELFI